MLVWVLAVWQRVTFDAQKSRLSLILQSDLWYNALHCFVSLLRTARVQKGKRPRHRDFNSETHLQDGV